MNVRENIRQQRQKRKEDKYKKCKTLQGYIFRPERKGWRRELEREKVGEREKDVGWQSIHALL